MPNTVPSSRESRLLAFKAKIEGCTCAQDRLRWWYFAPAPNNLQPPPSASEFIHSDTQTLIEISNNSTQNNPRIRTMTVEEGHVMNIDGGAKYRPVSSDGEKEGRIQSGVGRNSLFSEDVEGQQPRSASRTEVNPNNEDNDGRLSALSNGSGKSKTTSQLEAAAKLPWYRGVTCKDIRDITPTLLILLGGLLIMIFVIPYAFSSVIAQLKAENAKSAPSTQSPIAANETTIVTTEGNGATTLGDT